ncbi:MAG: T9SS type A sorting domain-containing protein [Bacteroidia bacterium]|nr:T9SS type A sorting domain-containing protein [Bacteroidia bacterium]
MNPFLRYILTFCTIFLLGSESLLYAQSFNQGILSGINLLNPTSLQFGPDNRLYVTQQHGEIYILTIVRNNAADYDVTDIDTILDIKEIPNHDDFGNASTNINDRQVTGIFVAGTANNPIIYVSSSDPREGAGAGSGQSGDLNLDTNSGIISKLTWIGSGINDPTGYWDLVHLVRGMPRSEENHANNDFIVDVTTNTVYATIGGFTNAGSPSIAFAFTCEYALAAAILSIDLNVIEALPTKTDAEGQKYKYDIPTLDHPTTIGGGDISGTHVPWGGNDGLNQAMLVQGGPVQIFSSGWRNVYDVVMTEAGYMYGCDNGANQGWGGHPWGEGPAIAGVSSATNEYCPGEGGSSGSGNPACDQSGDSQVNNENGLHKFSQGYYAGHPNPIRANPTGAGLYKDGVYYPTGSPSLPAAWPPVPAAMANPIEGDYKLPGAANGAQLTFSPPVNGLCEYTASNFGGVLAGDLLGVAYLGNNKGRIFRMFVDDSNGNVTGSSIFLTNFTSLPLDVTSLGDAGIYPGTIWTANHGSNTITVFEPTDYSGPAPTCVGNNDPLIDEDGDGFTNADELDIRNNTDPCNAGSQPTDNDGTLIAGFKVSDWNDPDDDDDGIADALDPFCIDPNNGTDITAADLPVVYPFFNADPGTGFFGLGFMGLMANGGTDYLEILNPDEDLIAGGATGTFTNPTVEDGSPLTNDLVNSYQFGIDISAAAEPVVFRTQMNGNFFNGGSDTDFLHGVYIGTGDQNNYVMAALVGLGGGNGGFRVTREIGGVTTSTDYPVANILASSVIHLMMQVDPSNGEIQPFYSADNGAETALGTPVSTSGNLLAAIQGTYTVSGIPSALATGVLASSGAGLDFIASWDFIEIYTVSQREILGATPDPLAFGNVNVGTPSVLAIDLATALNFSIDITDINVTGADAAMFVSAVNTIDDIIVSSPKTLEITFTPTSNGAKAATLELIHSGANSPLTIALSGTGANSGAQTILYRINNADSLVASGNSDPDWAVDLNASPSAYRVAGGNNQGNGVQPPTLTMGATLPVGTPEKLFRKERFDPIAGAEMQWEFPVAGAAGTPYEVRLYFANSCVCTNDPGERVFHIVIEGDTVGLNFDITATFGHRVAGMVSYDVNVDADGKLDIDFLRVVGDPMINAMEILTGGSPGGLPVEMLSFEAQAEGSDIQLKWTTSFELNNNGFEVQMLSPASQDFQTLGFVQGAGTTSEKQNYAYLVRGRKPGTYVFRLRQVDYDGHYTFSSRVSATVVAEKLGIYMYPNPSTGEVNLVIGNNDRQQVSVELYDGMGRLVKPLHKGIMEKGSQTLRFDLSDLPSGIYMLRATNGVTTTVERILTLQ